MQQFSCSLCDQNITYNLSDDSTYSSKVEQHSRMLGTSYNLRINHNYQSEVHVNVIIADKEGQYRAHKDSYIEESKDLENQTFQQFIQLRERFPYELQHYLKEADDSTKLILITKFSGFNKESFDLDEMQRHFMALYMEYTENQLIRFLYGKLNFYLGQTDLVGVFENLQPTDWLMPTYLRLISRKDPQAGLLGNLGMFEFHNNKILEAEFAIAFAEIGLRTGEMEKFDRLYAKYAQEWNHSPDVYLQQSFYIIQAYYAYNLYLQGKFKESREFIEPSYNFMSILQHRPVLIIIGNFYASILKNMGFLDRSNDIYERILAISRDLGDSRGELMVTSNLADIELQRGNIDKAIKYYDILYESKEAQDSVNFKLSAILNKTIALQQLGRNEEAFILLQEALTFQNLSFSFLIAIYSTFLRSVRNTKNADLLNILEHMIDYDNISNVPSGQIVLLDLKATRSMLEEHWSTTIEALEEELLIMNQHDQHENLLTTELRLADAYFNEFQKSKNQESVNECYRHLDLVRSLSGEQGYYPMLYEVTVLKAIITKELGFYDRSKNLLLQAQAYVNDYDLVNFKDEITEYLSQVSPQSVTEDASKQSSSIFAQLQNMAQRLIARASNSSTTVHGLLLIDREQLWSWGGHIARPELTNYLVGISDAISLALDQISFDRLKKTTGSMGEILVEFTDEFLFIIVAKTENYKLRVDMRDFLTELESFQLKAVMEEREQFIEERLSHKFGKLVEINFE